MAYINADEDTSDENDIKITPKGPLKSTPKAPSKNGMFQFKYYLIFY